MTGNWRSARRVLAIRLDAAGDVLMTEPALRALRGGTSDATPGRTVTLLTSPAGAAAAALLPRVDEVLVWDAPWMKHDRPPRAEDDLALLEQVRALAFDACAIFTVFSQNPLPAALFATWAGIPLRLAHCRENPYHLLTDWIPETDTVDAMRHEVQRQIDLVASVGAQVDDDRIRLDLPEEARARVRALLPSDGVRLALMHVGASASSRRYAPERFAEVACDLVARHGWHLAFTGEAHEAPLVEHVRTLAAVPSIDLTGLLSFAELAAAVAAADVLVCNNTAPAHLAAGVGTPVVDLYALTNPQHTPWRVEHRVLSAPVPCAYCFKSVCPEVHHGCLMGVTPAEVVRATLDLAAASRSTASASAR
ncbi:MAG: glycosyltransferase family 9 protein [Chloroflexi bacterium]|nr:glycosyltransferase family 9 protein [Chloroflexota bacterium]